MIKFYKDLIKVLENKEEAKLSGGSLYKVELAPKENEYLYWDKPLSEQPKGVREKLEGLGVKEKYEPPYDGQKVNGGTLRKTVSEFGKED